MAKKFKAFAAGIFALASCTTPAHRAVERIQIGQTKRMVLHEVGGPQSTARSRGKDVWEYRFLGADKQPKRLRVELIHGVVTAIQDAAVWESTVLARAESEDKANFAKDQSEYFRARSGPYTPNTGNPDGQ